MPAQGWLGQPGPVRCAPPPDDELRCGGSPMYRRARASLPAPAAAWQTLLRRGELRQSRLSTTSSARAPPAAVHAAEPAPRAACAGGKWGSSPSSAGPLRLIQKLPREAMRLLVTSSSSSAPARPPCPACLCSGISPRLRGGWAVQVCLGLPFPAFSVLREARASLRAGPGSGTAWARAELASPGSAPAFRLRGHRQMLLAAGSLWEGSLPVLVLPSIPSAIPTQTGFVLPKGSGGAGTAMCGVGSSLQQNTRLFRVLFKACLPPSSTSEALLPPPTLGASGGMGFLPHPPCPALCPSLPVSVPVPRSGIKSGVGKPDEALASFSVFSQVAAESRWGGAGDGAGQSAFLIDTAQDLTLSCPLIFPHSFLAAGCVIPFSLV